MAGDCGAIAPALEMVVREGRPAHLLIAGAGSLSVYPADDCYVTDIQDLDALLRSGPVQVRREPSPWAAGPATGRPLTELRWRAAFCAAEAGLAGSPGASHELLHLRSWPDLPRLPDELLAPLTRICALLWRKPTVGYLVARIVDLPARDTAVLLRVLQAFGHVAGCGPTLAKPGGTAPAAASRVAEEEAEPDPVPSVVTKLWQRLLGLQPA
jgi:hypothetical protein